MNSLARLALRGGLVLAALVFCTSATQAQQHPDPRDTATVSSLLSRSTFTHVVSLDTSIARSQSSSEVLALRDTTLWTRRQHIYVGMVVGAVGFATAGLIATWNDGSTCVVEASGSGGGCPGTGTKVIEHTAIGLAFGALGAGVGAAVGAMLRADSMR